LAASNPIASPPSLLLADWESSTAAEGCSLRPSAARTEVRSASCTRVQVPSALQAANQR
jgi:hypothetical protein